MWENSEPVIAMISAPVTDAHTIAEKLVSLRLAACAQVLQGISSYYRWKGNIEKDEESLIIVKTVRQNEQAIRDFLKEVHPYEVPEFVLFPITGGNPDYIAWLRAETLPPASST